MNFAVTGAFAAILEGAPHVDLARRPARGGGDGRPALFAK